MTVRPTDARPTSPALPIDGAGSRSSVQTGQSPPAPAASASADQVEISPEARARAAESRSTLSDPEIETARTALRSESLSDARLHELRERVRTGHYDKPETIDRIASAAVRDLGAE